MSTQKNLITLCFAAVFTLGLAACGGGGGGGDALVTGMTDMTGVVIWTGDEPAAPTVAELFATAQDSKTPAAARRKTAGDAVDGRRATRSLAQAYGVKRRLDDSRQQRRTPKLFSTRRLLQRLRPLRMPRQHCRTPRMLWKTPRNMPRTTPA